MIEAPAYLTDLRFDAHYHAPTDKMIAEYAEKCGCSEDKALDKFLAAREKKLAARDGDMFRLGWEPSIWWVSDALLDIEWCTDNTRDILAERLGVPHDKAWAEFKGRMRTVLGFNRPIRYLLQTGANGSGKSEHSSKRAVGAAFYSKRECNIRILCQSKPKSVEDLEPLVYKYFPPEWREDCKESKTYLSYKRGTGFTIRAFVAPTGARGCFNTYHQKVEDVLEGGDLPWIFPDELMPRLWADKAFFRLSRANGRMLLTFTPVKGYTPTVKLWQDGMTVVRNSTAFCLPRDGKEALPWRELGLTKDEYAEILDAHDTGRSARAPQSRAEDCLEWLTDGNNLTTGKVKEDGIERVFDTVPRVAKCVDPDKAVIWMHSADNPYSNPAMTIQVAMRKGVDYTKTRVYGLALRQSSVKFPQFSDRVHVVDDDKIPFDAPVQRRYVMMDPSGRRNNAMGWILSTPECDYFYREWPGNYDIPGIGTPGAWAKESDTKGGINDGAQGEAQEDFCFDLQRYKFEIARLEGWVDYGKWKAQADGNPAVYNTGRFPFPRADELDAWNDGNGSDEPIDTRMADGRTVATGINVGAQATTMLTELNRLGMTWVQAPGMRVEEGEKLVGDALSYLETENGSNVFLTPTKLKIAASCSNMRWAMSNFTGADGQKGACKEWIDMLRWFYTADLALCRGAQIRHAHRTQWRRQGSSMSMHMEAAPMPEMPSRVQSNRPMRALAGGRSTGGARVVFRRF